MLGPDKSAATPSSATNVVLGLGGVSRHACAALCVDGRLVGACEQERLTRVRGAGPNPSGLPDEAIDALLAAQRLPRDRIRRVGIAERWGQSVGPGTLAQDEHHLVHAAAAHLTSGFSRAAILVCDHEAPQVVVCLGDGATVTRLAWPSREPGPAALYADAAIALGFGGGGEGQHLEAFARLEAGCRLAEVDDLFAYTGDGIVATPGWMGRLAATGEGGTDWRARVASAVQTRLGDLLLALVADVRRATGATHLSLAGSLFYNTALCSRIKTAEGFEDVFVPVNPGNAGLAVGSALLAAEASPARVSAMLGPTFGAGRSEAGAGQLQARLRLGRGCGLRTARRRCPAGRQAGGLVRRPDGMGPPGRWTPAPILANPFSPFVLENLNRFLEHRQPWRGYAVSCLEGAAADAFDGRALGAAHGVRLTCRGIASGSVTSCPARTRRSVI